jgi:hypothetical protein
VENMDIMLMIVQKMKPLEKLKENFQNKKQKRLKKRKQLVLKTHCNRCGANNHDTNSCPYNPFKNQKKKFIFFKKDVVLLLAAHLSLNIAQKKKF